MSHVIQVPVPDEWFDQLAAYAEQRGQTPETLLLALAADAVQSQHVLPPGLAALPPHDPMRILAGIINIPLPPDWADTLDSYVDGEEDANNE
mgnify:CR=1 FL=1